MVLRESRIVAHLEDAWAMLRSRERFLAKLTQAAVAVDPDEAVVLSDQALILDNESLTQGNRI